MLCVHRFIGLFHLDASFLSKHIETIQGLIKCSVLCQNHMGVSLGGLKMMLFFLSKVFLTKVSKIFSEFWKVHTHWNTAKLVQAPKIRCVLGVRFFLPNISQLAPFTLKLPEDLSQMHIAFGAMEVRNVQTGAFWGVFRNPRNCPHKNHSRVLLIRIL